MQSVDLRTWAILGALLCCHSISSAQTLQIYEQSVTTRIGANYMNDPKFMSDAMRHAVQHDPQYQGLSWRRLFLDSDGDQQQQIAWDYLQYLSNQRTQNVPSPQTSRPIQAKPNLDGQQLAFEAVKHYAGDIGCLNSFDDNSTNLSKTFKIPKSPQLNDNSEHYVVWWAYKPDCDFDYHRHLLTAVFRTSPNHDFVIKYPSVLPSDEDGKAGLTPDIYIEDIQQRPDGGFDIMGGQVLWNAGADQPAGGSQYKIPITYDGIGLTYGNKHITQTWQCSNRHCQAFDVNNQLIDSFELP